MVASGQRVVAVHEQVGDVGEHRLAAQRRRHVEAHALPAVHDRDVGATRGDLGHGVPRLGLVHHDVEVGRAAAAARRAAAGRHRAPRSRRRRGAAGPTGRPASPCTRERSRSTCSPSTRPSSTSRRPAAVSTTPRPARSSRVAPTWRSSRLTCWETADGVKPSSAAAPPTLPQRSTATRDSTAARSIMQRCYRDRSRRHRWCFTVDAGRGSTGATPPHRPRRARRGDLGRQLRRHRPRAR